MKEIYVILGSIYITPQRTEEIQVQSFGRFTGFLVETVIRLRFNSQPVINFAVLYSEFWLLSSNFFICKIILCGSVLQTPNFSQGQAYENEWYNKARWP